MSKIMLPSDMEFKGLNCDSEPSTSLENMGKPKVTVDLRKQVGLFPPAFNELRKQLYEEHVDLWEVVGGMMIYNHEYFLQSMNDVLDCRCDARQGIQACCEHWLKALQLRVKTRRLG